MGIKIDYFFKKSGERFEQLLRGLHYAFYDFILVQKQLFIFDRKAQKDFKVVGNSELKNYLMRI